GVMGTPDLDDDGWDALLVAVERAKVPIAALRNDPPAQKLKRSETQSADPSVGGLFIKEKLEVYFDGCCEPKNPGGHAGYGALIRVADSKQVLTDISGYIPAAPETSNNVGEYSALLSAFKWLREAGLTHNRIAFWGDS